MPDVVVNHVNKSYGNKPAVVDLSFTIEPHEIFGLIGPNGAGKSTTIRMMLDIIKPDSGKITVFDRQLSSELHNRLGYLPEDRGLYRKLRVMETIYYLSSLKGLDRPTALKRADILLQRTGLSGAKNKRIEELSKGMGQIIQFIVTIIHDPQLIIMDEPFSGLDPVNTELLKSIILDLRQQGKSIILSTHQMNQVEELCDRTLMVNNGRAVLYGDLLEIKSKYRSNAVFLDARGDIGNLTGVIETRQRKGFIELILNDKTTPQQILEQLTQRGVNISRFEIATPSLNEIFLKVARSPDE
jgi:ABC-2 type transport system ATP-binding protein